MTPHDKHELIKRYLLDIANKEERAEVESLAGSDPEFAEELQFQTQLKFALKQGPAMDNLRAQLDNIHRQRSNRHPQGRPRRLYPLLAVAASLALLIAAGWWLLMRHDISKPSTADLYAAYFSPPDELIPGLITRNGKDQELSEELQLWYSAATAYSQADYAAVMRCLDTLASLPSVDHEQIAWYRGLTRLCMDQPSEALIWFSQVVDIFQEDRVWYMAMAHLRLNQPDSARQFLQQVADESHGRKKKAEELLARLSGNTAQNQNANPELPDINKPESTTQPVSPYTPSLQLPAKHPGPFASLSESYYLESAGQITVRGSTAQETKSDSLLNLYKIGRYTAVIDSIKQMSDNNPEKIQLLPLLADAYFKSGNYRNAYQLWLRIDQGGMTSPDLTDWNLLITRMALLPDNQNEFNAQLEAILADKDHSYFDKALKIKKEVELIKLR